MLSVHHKRLLVIANCFFASLGCGTVYIFSAYSTQLADRLGFTATQTEFIGMTGGMGVSLLGAVAGIVIDRFGPRLPSAIGTVLLLLGYYSIYLAYVHRFQSVANIALALFFAGFGSTMAYNSCVKAAAMNFPKFRGTATAFPLASYGLSAFFFTTVTLSIVPQGDTADFIKTLAIGTSGLCALNCPWVKVYGPKKDGTTGDEEEQAEQQSLLSQGLSAPSLSSPTKDTNVASCNSQDYGWKLLFRLEFWEQFMLLGLLSGTGQMFIYSVGFCVRALLSPSTTHIDPNKVQSVQALQVGVISLPNFAFRLLSGSLSDFVSRHYNFQRLWLVVLAGTISFITQITAQIMTNPHYVWILSLLTGSSYGLLFGVMPSIVGESFGMDHFSQNWGWVAAAPVFSSYILNMVFGKIYDSHSTWIVGNDGLRTNVCTIGIACYSQAFVMTSFTSLASILLALYMIWSKKHAYHMHSS